ncbi:MAG: hypothetical protein GF398_13585 [Chitinivibrionales bacterium]|nr:hypothetical protein [Chitinivibrionales bacterium]
MCGRFVRRTDTSRLAEKYAIGDIASTIAPSFNIAPRQPVAVVIEDGRKKMITMQWGLIPSWAKDAGIGNKLINARARVNSAGINDEDCIRPV